MKFQEPAKKIIVQALGDESLPGEFSGLHLLSIQYVAFKKIAPGQNIGFDLGAEYEAAMKLFEKPR